MSEGYITCLMQLYQHDSFVIMTSLQICKVSRLHVKDVSPLQNKTYRIEGFGQVLSPHCAKTHFSVCDGVDEEM